MASTNGKTKISIKTEEGGKASVISNLEKLKRITMTCMLWEDNFYIDGETVANQIVDLVSKVGEENARKVLFEAKRINKLRHAPLLILVAMAKNKWLKRSDVCSIITRPDDMTELLSLYWKDGKKPIAKSLLRGLGDAFRKFDEYQLAKYNRDKDIKLADILKLSRPKPVNEEQSTLWKKLLSKELKTPLTWETELSAGKNKKETFEMLMKENKLPDLAFIRNLRNMVNIDKSIIANYAETRNWSRILPFQFVTSARYNPRLEDVLEKAMLKCLEGQEKINGKVNLLIDVSGSMDYKLSSKSETTRLDVASGLAILLREVCENISIYTFSNDTNEIPLRHGFALRDFINKQYRGGTQMWSSIKTVGMKGESDITIVLTDEQTSDCGSISSANTGILFIINVASNENGVGYGNKSVHINGWSESIVDYIREYLK